MGVMEKWYLINGLNSKGNGVQSKKKLPVIRFRKEDKMYRLSYNAFVAGLESGLGTIRNEYKWFAKIDDLKKDAKRDEQLNMVLKTFVFNEEVLRKARMEYSERKRCTKEGRKAAHACYGGKYGVLLELKGSGFGSKAGARRSGADRINMERAERAFINMRYFRKYLQKEECRKCFNEMLTYGPGQFKFEDGSCVCKNDADFECVYECVRKIKLEGHSELY